MLHLAHTAAVAATLLAAATWPAAAQSYSQAIVVGDSLSDTGTFSGVTATGRFTTTPGRLWTEVVADHFGLSVAPAYIFDGEAFRPQAGGTNYAQSGTLVLGEAGLYDGHSRSIAWQVDQVIEQGGGQVDPKALYLVDGGGPDVLMAAMLVGQGQLTPEAAVEQAQGAGRALAQQTRRLSDAGAKHLVLLGVANFGATPALGAGQGDASALATQLSRAFNDALTTETAASGLTVVAPDVFGFFDGLITDPDAHGLVNVTEPAVDPERAAPTPTGNSANSNPSHLVRADAARTYLFADGLHPSGRGHELLGEFVLEQLSDAGSD